MSFTSTTTTNLRVGSSPVSRAPQRLLSGITPSGSLTLGNYLGALKRFVDGQRDHEGFFFVADLHALTTHHDPGRLRDLTVETAALFFAAGLDPSHSTVFLQSHVPAHVQLSYLLESTAHVGELARMIQFKEKGGRPQTRASLFTYPCLMAADILLYETGFVPVGGDQSQHVELARDLAVRFNRLYGPTFVVPELAPAMLAARVTDLSHPEVKMNKSAEPSAIGVIRMLDSPDLIVRKMNRAVTDSDGEVRYDPAVKPGVSNLLDILAAVSGERPVELATRFSSYGELKKACGEAVIAALGPIQRRHAELMADRPTLDAMLREGVARARSVAEPVLARAQTAMGLVSPIG
ncbi:MAG: tryptophan--tRNA ligase [Nocardioidaceae bacterium]